jgi:DNA-binding transcriptional LysR family regulator
MDLRHLRTFITVADAGTVSKASVLLHVAQPALSRQIKELEDELGVRLFQRVRRRLILTAEGERLLADSRAVLGAAHRLTENAKLLLEGNSGTLRVAAPAQMMERVFSAFLHEYAQRRPNIQIRLTEAAGPKMLMMLERGDIDLAVGLQRLMGDNSFETIALPAVEFLAASHASFSLGRGGTVEVSKLAPYPLLLLEPTYLFRHTFDAACRLAGFKPNIFLESRTAHSLLSLAEARHGVAVVPSVAPTTHYNLQIKRLQHRGKVLREPQCIFWDSRRALAPYATDFCESLAAYVREALGDRRAR